MGGWWCGSCGGSLVSNCYAIFYMKIYIYIYTLHTPFSKNRIFDPARSRSSAELHDLLLLAYQRQIEASEGLGCADPYGHQN